MVAEAVAVVGREHDDGVVEPAGRVQRREQASDLAVDQRDVREVVRELPLAQRPRRVDDVRRGVVVAVGVLVAQLAKRRRLRLAIESVIATPDAKANGIGDVTQARLSTMVAQVSEAFALKNAVKPEQVFTPAFLPPKADRMIFR